ncbi:hypothetical protein GF406_26145 [candidate division KSB1 bacterium]|jgi:hypothetical protein|nr:hypothetical protein [candidate division KSB1 bacterium]
MNRRKFFKFIVAGLAAAGLLKTTKNSQSEPLTDQPNPMMLFLPIL